MLHGGQTITRKKKVRGCVPNLGPSKSKLGNDDVSSTRWRFMESGIPTTPSGHLPTVHVLGAQHRPWVTSDLGRSRVHVKHSPPCEQETN